MVTFIELLIFLTFLGKAFNTSDPIWAIAAALFYFASNYNEDGKNDC